MSIQKLLTFIVIRETHKHRVSSAKHPARQEHSYFSGNPGDKSCQLLLKASVNQGTDNLDSQPKTAPYRCCSQPLQPQSSIFQIMRERKAKRLLEKGFKEKL